MATRYANLYGLSDRTSVIAVSGTTSFGVGSPSGLVNGAYGNTQFFGGGQTGTYLEFDFGEPILIDEIKWYQDNASTHGVWQWQGYDTGSSSWVNIGATFTLGGAPQTINTMAGVTAYYSKYRLQQISGATSSSPWIQEIEFKNERAATDANFANVVLLMPFDEIMYDLAYHDRSSAAHTITASPAGTDIEPGQHAYGDRSVIFYGPNNGYLTIPDSPDWDLGGAPFTIEARVYDDNYAFGKLIVGNWGDNSGGQRGWILYVDAGSTGSQGKIAFAAASSGATIGIDLKGASGSIIAGAYRSVCVDYDGTYLRLFVDNVMQAKSAWSGVIAAGTYPLRMGRDNSGSFSGTLMYRQDVRITKGVSLHGSDASYTLPLKPYPEKGAASAPTITSVAPTGGSTAGGTAVTITGTGFTGSTNVTFGGVNATSIVVASSTSITCVAPAHAAGAVDVKVFNPAGDVTAVSAYTYSGATLTAIAPNTGLNSGGDPVTLTGTLFTGATDVKIGGNSATSIVVVNATTITCVTPAHAVGVVAIQVFTPAGNPTLAASFTYTGDPELRITQAPLLVLDLSPQGLRVTQAPILILYQEKQPNRITQAPLLVLYEPKPIPLPRPIIPDLPVYETWNWLTVINPSYKGLEQRSRLRETPRYKLDMGALILDEADRVSVYNLLMRYLKTPFLYPFFHYNAYLTASAATTETKLFADTTLSDFRDGEFIALFDPELNSVFYLETTTIDANGVNLAAPLAFDVPSYWQICPAIEFRIAPSVGINMRAIDGDFRLVMESTKPRVFQRPGAAPTLTTVDGILVIPERPLANDDVKETFDFNVTWFDNKTSVPDNLNEWENPKVSSVVQFLFNRKAEIDYWRAIIDTLKGRQGVVLLPTFRNDLPLRAPIALNATTFTTFNTSFFKWWLDLTYRYIMIENANEVKYLSVSSVDPHYDTNGDPDYITVTLGASIGNTAGDNDIRSISYMPLYRLDNDSVKLTHSDIETMIELEIKAVDK